MKIVLAQFVLVKLILAQFYKFLNQEVQSLKDFNFYYFLLICQALEALNIFIIIHFSPDIKGSCIVSILK